MEPSDIAALLARLPGDAEERDILVAVAEELLARAPDSAAQLAGASVAGSRATLAVASRSGATATTTAALENELARPEVGEAGAAPDAAVLDQVSGPGAVWIRRRGIERVLTVCAGSEQEPALLHFGWPDDDAARPSRRALQRLIPFVIVRLERARHRRRAGDDTPPTRSAGAASRSATLVLVEDEGLVRDAMTALLTDHGHRVIPCARARTALTVLAERSDDVDLVVTDVVMPDMDGAELARELEELAPQLKVLFVSGFTAALHDRIRLDDRRAFLQKPYTEDVLLARIADLLAD